MVTSQGQWPLQITSFKYLCGKYPLSNCKCRRLSDFVGIFRMKMKPGVECGTFKGTEKWWVCGGAEVPLHLSKWTHFSASLQTFLSLALVSMVLAIPSQVLHRVNEAFVHSWVFGIVHLSRYLLQRSHGGALNIQVRTGWAARELRPLDADVFTAGVSFQSFQSRVAELVYLWNQEPMLFTRGWLSTCLHFPSEVKISLGSKVLKQGEKAGAVGWGWQQSPIREGGGRGRYLGCRGGRRSRAGSRSVRTRGGRARCCARTGDTAGCSGGRKTQGGKLKTEQPKLSQLFQRLLITESSRTLCLS